MKQGRMDQGPAPLAFALPGDRKSFIDKKADMVKYSV